MSIYKVRTSDGCRFRMRWTPEQPELPIMFDMRSDSDWAKGARWIPMHIRSGKARCVEQAADIVNDYWGAPLTWVKSIERID